MEKVIRARSVAVRTAFVVLFALAAIGARAAEAPASYTPDVSFSLKTSIAEGRLVFIGVGGTIDEVVNPELSVATNQVVQITLINGDGVLHDLAVPDFGVKSEQIAVKDSSTAIVFRASKSGSYFYFCSVPGHRAAGMEGKLTVGKPAAVMGKAPPSIVKPPIDLPPAIGKRAPKNLKIELETIEMEARLADGATFRYWTFNGTVPGPFLRIRQGDTVEVTLKNSADNQMIHSVDFHAVTGPGGGAKATQTAPGKSHSFTFKALNPGLFVYHCATPMVAQHIANGMYGLILVEPPEGLPKVDREFYVMQGEIYTSTPFGKTGLQEFSVAKLLDERPEYLVLNGAVGSLTKEHPMKAKVGETVRIFFGVGGPNVVSSFHVIGEIFDRVYPEASLTSPPLNDVQTTMVPAGGATMVEFKLEVPGTYILVDHSLSRLERGLVGLLHAEGPDNHEVFKASH